MRVNTQNVFKAWKEGRSCRKRRSIWTADGIIYSYSTRIMHRNHMGQIVLNMEKYSPTTSNHQNGLRELLRRDDSVWCFMTIDKPQTIL